MSGLDDYDFQRLVYLVILLALLLAGMVSWRGAAERPQLRHLAIWLLIGVGLVTIYAYRTPLLRFAAPVIHELDPSRVVEITDPDGATELAIARAGDGHFYLDAEANGATIEFLVDTGASSSVLTLADAERAGIDIAALEFTRPMQTANGISYYAPATLPNLSIGPFRLTSVPVGIVPEGALGVSLLGMSTIDRFSNSRIEGDRMVLVP